LCSGFDEEEEAEMVGKKEDDIYTMLGV